jgi:hypothetical protein
MQVRFERVKVSGFHINTAFKWERGGWPTREECLLKTRWCLQVVFPTALDRRTRQGMMTRAT